MFNFGITKGYLKKKKSRGGMTAVQLIQSNSVWALNEKSNTCTICTVHQLNTQQASI